MAKRVVLVLAAVGFVIACFAVANSVQSNARTGEDLANGAPQQTVAETTATRDAGVNGLRLLGVLGGLVVVGLAALAPTDAAEEAASESKMIRDGLRRRCPFCAELIRPAATVCRYCGRGVPEAVEDDFDEGA